jgi:hypothetical protein
VEAVAVLLAVAEEVRDAAGGVADAVPDAVPLPELVKVYADALLVEVAEPLAAADALKKAEPVAEAVAVASADGVGGEMKENRTKPSLPSRCAMAPDITVAMLPHAPKPRPLT